ncbi:MAG: ankyrin repeat domain-containing protein [Chlamydiales bacterium]|nr:ankyrin repeat domain-containing protein [Chlamydiales bacterium]
MPVSNLSIQPSFWPILVDDLAKLKDSAIYKDNDEIQQLFNRINDSLSFSDVDLKELNILIKHIFKSEHRINIETDSTLAECITRIQRAGQILQLIHCVKNVKPSTDLDAQLPDLRSAVALFNQDDVFEENGANLLLLCAKSRNYAVRSLALECLQHGASCQSKDLSNVTALHYACAYNDEELVTALLSQGADRSIATKAGFTPLHLLIKHSGSNTILAFLQQKPEILSQKLDGVSVYSKVLETCLQNGFCSDLEKFLESHLSKEILEECGSTLFQVACTNKSQKWVEKTIGAAGDLSEQERDFITEIFNRLATSNQHGKETLLFLETSWKKGVLPLGPLKGAKSALRIVNEALHLNLQDPIIEYFGQFQTLYTTLKSDLFSLSAPTILDNLHKCVRQLREQGYAGCDLYENRLKAVETAFQHQHQTALKWLREFEANANVEWLTMKKGICEFSLDVESLLTLCCKENKQHLMLPLINKHLNEQTPVKSFTKFFHHLVFDKTWMKSPTLASDTSYEYDGGRLSVNTPFFLQQIAGTLTSSLSSNTMVNTLMDRFVNNFSVANAYLCLWDAWGFCSDKRPQIAPEIVERMKDPSQKFVLVPTGFKGHAALLLVEKGDKTAKITMYNTGGGLVQEHPQWKNSNRYQTFKVIEEVPLEDLENVELWQKFVEESSQATSMDPVYVCFEELGRRGHLVDPSCDSEDFESKQLNGTCSLHCYLALFRHQIMTLAEGTKQEKLTAYRLTKAYTVSHAIKQSSHRLERYFGNRAKLKLSKYEDFIQLSKIAEDESSYQDHLNLLTASLEQIGAHSFLDSIRQAQPFSVLSRLALLEKCSQKLANHQSFDIARVDKLWVDRQANLTAINSLIKHHLDAGEFKTLGLYLARFYISSRFSKEMQKTVIEIANSSIPLAKKQDLMAGLIKMNRYNPGKVHLHQLCEALIANKQESLAEFVQEQMKLGVVELTSDAI